LKYFFFLYGILKAKIVFLFAVISTVLFLYISTFLRKSSLRIKSPGGYPVKANSGVINKSQPSLLALIYNFFNFLKLFSKSPKSV